MCEFNVGDKFIVEIGEVYCPPGFSLDSDEGCPKLYKMKGFKSLVFDEEGLKKLEKIENKDNELIRFTAHILERGDVVEDIDADHESWIITNVHVAAGGTFYSGLYRTGETRKVLLTVGKDLPIRYTGEYYPNISDWLNF